MPSGSTAIRENPTISIDLGDLPLQLAALIEHVESRIRYLKKGPVRENGVSMAEKSVKSSILFAMRIKVAAKKVAVALKSQGQIKTGEKIETLADDVHTYFKYQETLAWGKLHDLVKKQPDDTKQKAAAISSVQDVLEVEKKLLTQINNIVVKLQINSEAA